MRSDNDINVQEVLVWDSALFGSAIRVAVVGGHRDVDRSRFRVVRIASGYPVVKALEKRPRAGSLPLRFVTFRSAPCISTLSSPPKHAESANAQRLFWGHARHAVRASKSIGALFGCASMLRLDQARFTQYLAEHRRAPKVREDFIAGVRSGVSGTLTFFIKRPDARRLPIPRRCLAAIHQAAESPRAKQRETGLPPPRR
jgi:hypothetical protein